MEHDVIWLLDHRRFAFLISRHAHYSIVRVDDQLWQVLNDDYEYWEERAFEYEEEK